MIVREQLEGIEKASEQQRNASDLGVESHAAGLVEASKAVKSV